MLFFSSTRPTGDPMLHTFEHDGLVRRMAMFFSADWPGRLIKSSTKPILWVHLHDRDESAIQAMRDSEYYQRLLDPKLSLPPFVLLFPEGLCGTPTRRWTPPVIEEVVEDPPPAEEAADRGDPDNDPFAPPFLVPPGNVAPPNLGDDPPEELVVATFGAFDQGTSSWNVPSAMAARISGADDAGFVRRCMGDAEQFCRTYLSERYGVRWTDPLFDKVVMAGRGVGAELAARVASLYPQHASALVLYAGTTGTRVARGPLRRKLKLMQAPSPTAPPIPVWMVHGQFDARYPPAGGTGTDTVNEVAAALGLPADPTSPDLGAFLDENVRADDCLAAWLAPWAVAAPAPTTTTTLTTVTLRPDGLTPVERQIEIGRSTRWDPAWVDAAVAFLTTAGVL